MSHFLIETCPFNGRCLELMKLQYCYSKIHGYRCDIRNYLSEAYILLVIRRDAVPRCASDSRSGALCSCPTPGSDSTVSGIHRWETRMEAVASKGTLQRGNSTLRSQWIRAPSNPSRDDVNDSPILMSG